MDKITLKCIFCLEDTSSSKSEEHIIPESLGCNVKLEKGIVCDKCNNYFSKNIDKSLQEYHFIGILKPLLVGLTKKKKGPKIDLNDLVIERESYGDVVKFMPKGTKMIIDKKNRRICFKFRRRFPNLQYVSRALYKIYFEIICLKKGKKEIMKREYNNLRKYIKAPYKEEYWSFVQRPLKMKSVPFRCSFENKYSKNCFRLQIFDIEFILEKNGQLPIDKLHEDNYEIIDREKYEIIKKERKIKDLQKIKPETFYLKYRHL